MIFSCSAGSLSAMTLAGSPRLSRGARGCRRCWRPAEGDRGIRTTPPVEVLVKPPATPPNGFDTATLIENQPTAAKLARAAGPTNQGATTRRARHLCRTSLRRRQRTAALGDFLHSYNHYRGHIAYSRKKFLLAGVKRSI